MRNSKFKFNPVSRVFKLLGVGLLMTISFISCKNANAPVVYADFPLQKELQAMTVELDTAIFRYPFRIRVHQDRVIVLDLHNKDYYYHMFSYPDFTYLNSFGKRGNAPDELLMAENFRFVENKETEVWTLDSNRSKVTRLGFSLSSDSLLVTKAIALDKSLLRPLDFCLYQDSLMVIPDYSGESRFCFLNLSGELLYRTGNIPTSNKKALQESKPTLSQAWRSFVDYHPEHNVLAAVTQLGEVLEIYNMSDSTSKIIMGPHGEPDYQEMEGYAIPSGIMGFSDIQITDKYIYTVFHGRTFKDMMKRGQPVIDGGQYIYVFDLEGNPVCKYVLDRYIYGIFVDEKENRILATDVNSDQPLIYFSI